MNAVLRSGGWLVAFVLILVAGAMVYSLQEKNRQLAGLETRLNHATEEAALARKALEASKESSALPGSSARQGSKKRPNPRPPETDAPGPSPEPGAERTPPPEPPNTAWAESRAETALNMQYRALFQQLNLPAETEAELRRILKQFIAAHMHVHPGAAPGAGSVMLADESAFAPEEDKVKLSAELARILSAEELAQFQEYQDTLPRHLIEQQYEAELRTAAPELTEQNLALVKQTFAEEMLAVQQADAAERGGPPDPARGHESLQREQEALHNALGRLAPVMDQEQYAVAERYVSQREQMAGAPSNP